VKHASRVKLACVQFSGDTGVGLGETDDDVPAGERRWKTGRVGSRSTVSSHAHRNISINIDERLERCIVKFHSASFGNSDKDLLFTFTTDLVGCKRPNTGRVLAFLLQSWDS